MSNKLTLHLMSLALLLAATAAAGAQVPVVVSPGGSQSIAVIADRCPTFSWGTVAGADRYDIVVYLVPAGQGIPSTDPILSVAIPGSANSWTPSLEQCLASGARYAWSLRAAAEQETSEWSAPVFFDVQPDPTVSEVENALEVLRSFLGREETGDSDLPSAGQIALLLDRETPLGRESDRGERQPPSEPAVPPGFEAGIEAELIGEAVGTLGVHGASRSPIEGSSGVWGESLAVAGKVAGIKGTSLSFEGWGGYFQNYFPAVGPSVGTGLFAGGGPGVGDPPVLSSDLVLGGWGDIGGGVIDDEGTLASDPRFPSSDLVLFSNDELRVHLNIDADSETGGSWFTILGGLNEVFKVDALGNAFVKENLEVTGDMTVVGAVGGSLVSQAEVEAAVAAAVADHENQYHPRRVFVTNTTYTGNLGGVTGADQKCQNSASSAGLEGTFIAWISEPGSNARDRLTTRSTRAYWTPDGVKIADSWTDLVTADPDYLDHAIDRNEFGNPVASSAVWTATTTSGNWTGSGTPGHCSYWTEEIHSNHEAGWTGLSSRTDQTWTGSGNQNCANYGRLYCFQN